MSRSRKKQDDITTQPAARAPTGITNQPARAASAPDAPGALGALPLWGAGLLVLLTLFVVFWALRQPEPPHGIGSPSDRTAKADPNKGKTWEMVLMEMADKGRLNQEWRPEPWEPSSAADKVIDRFVTLKKAGDRTANDLLAGKALAEGEVIAEADVEPRATDTFLRQPFTITAIYRGEPDGKGGQKAAANRYTIAGTGPVTTPHYRVRGAGPSSSFITKDLELVVEVRDGKIHGVRSTAGR